LGKVNDAPLAKEVRRDDRIRRHSVPRDLPDGPLVRCDPPVFKPIRHIVKNGNITLEPQLHHGDDLGLLGPNLVGRLLCRFLEAEAKTSDPAWKRW